MIKTDTYQWSSKRTNLQEMPRPMDRATERTNMGMHGITEALDWAKQMGSKVERNEATIFDYEKHVRALEEEKHELNQRLIKLAEDNMTLVHGSNQMMDDHKKVIANLLVEVETVKSNAGAQAEALTAEVEKLKEACALLRKQRDEQVEKRRGTGKR